MHANEACFFLRSTAMPEGGGPRSRRGRRRSFSATTRLVLRWPSGKVAEGRCGVAYANSVATRQRWRKSTMKATVQLLVLRCVVRTALVNGLLISAQT